MIRDLKVVARTNASVTLSWRAVNGSEAYMVTPDARVPYPEYETITTKKNSIAVEGLSPGIMYTFKVKAFKRNFIGQEGIIAAFTEGMRLPDVQNLVARLTKPSGTTVKLSWEMPKDARKVQWQYGIYYALNAPDLFKSKCLNPANPAED